MELGVMSGAAGLQRGGIGAWLLPCEDRLRQARGANGSIRCHLAPARRNDAAACIGDAGKRLILRQCACGAEAEPAERVARARRIDADQPAEARNAGLLEIGPAGEAAFFLD